MNSRLARHARIFPLALAVSLCVSPLSGVAFGSPAGGGIASLASSECSAGVLRVHFETLDNGVALENSGMEPPLGSLAEAYDLGPGFLYCGAFWFTSMRQLPPIRSYVYVWEGGISDEPQRVLAVIPDVEFQAGIWPAIVQNDIPIDLEVAGPFTVGFWSECSAQSECELIAVDTDSQTGYPWAYCICLGDDIPTWHRMGYPEWEVTALGIGVYFGAPPVPVGQTTWGRIKSLY